MAAQVLIGIGSNLNDRLSYLRRATTMVQTQCGTVLAASSCYETEPIGNCANQRFLNAVVRCQTNLSPHTFWQRLHAIEAHLGRVRTHRWANRTIDLDILLWQNSHGEAELINLPDLKIPHPHMLFRDFVMLPATEIAPYWQHPYHRQMLKQVPTKVASIVRRLPQEL